MKKIAVFMVCLLLFQVSSASMVFARADDSGYAGEWACVAIDPGTGTKQTQYEGANVADMFKIQFNQDGTLLVTSFGELIPGTWAESAGGVSAVIDGGPVEFAREGSQLVNNMEGFLIYLEKAGGKPNSGGLLSLVKSSKYAGKWDAVSIDTGDGVPVTEMDGVKVSDLMAFQINRDGTLEMISMGLATAGTWQEIEGGIRVNLEGMETDMLYSDEQLMAISEGATIVFARADNAGGTDVTSTPPPIKAAGFAGIWKAVRFDTAGTEYDASMLFPDGCTLTLLEDGTGKAVVTTDYAETLTWAEKDGVLTLGGSYVFKDPVMDAEKDELKLVYSSSVFVIFQRSDAGPAPTATAAVMPTEVSVVPTAAPTAPPTAAPTMAPTVEPTVVPAVGNEDPGLCDMTLFTARFPEGWAANEGWSNEREGYSYSKYELKDAGGSILASVIISASSEGVRTYRDKVKSLLETAEKAGRKELDEAVIGGIRFTGTDYENWGWKYIDYTARVAEAGITLMITIERPDNIGGSLQPILESISYKLPVLTPPNVDPPLPEDGTPYEPVTSSAVLGEKEITAEWVRSDKSIILDSMFDNRIEMVNDTLYVLAGKKLYAYMLEGSSLAPGSAPENGFLKLDDDYEFLSVAKDTLYVSQGMFNILAVSEGAVTEKYNLSGDLVMAPGEDWGITYWYNADPKVVHITGSEVTAEPWVLSGLTDAANRKGRFSSISCLAITGDRIYVAGTDTQSGDVQRCAAFDLEGNELFSFGAADWTEDDALGSVTGIVETGSGILVQDGNYRSFKLFSKEGGFLGKVDCDDLLGTDYPWLSSAVITKEGVLVAAVQERTDKSCYELLIFRIKGL